jgi:hypothetical protein
LCESQFICGVGMNTLLMVVSFVSGKWGLHYYCLLLPVSP